MVHFRSPVSIQIFTNKLLNKNNFYKIGKSIFLFASGADGRKYRTRYTADEKGYHPHTELEEVEIPE